MTQFPPNSIRPGGGLYHGPISIAFLFFVLAPLYPDMVLTSEEIKLGTWFAVYMKQAQDHMASYPGPKPSKCGVSDDILCLLALGAASSKDPDMAQELCDFRDVVLDPEASVEWLYGRAGYLYLLRLVRESFIDSPEVLELLNDTADQVINAIMDTPRPWKWHGKAYVGAVHGAVGVVTQIILTDPTWARELSGELEAVLSQQFDGPDGGNWPSSTPAGKDRLVQICHGAPGVLTSLLSIRRHFPAEMQARMEEAIARGRRAIRQRGLLTKEPCLCHGISGNALALEHDDFEHFLTYTTKHEIEALERDGMLEPSDDPSSLFCGEAGRAYAWAVAHKGLEKRLIGYNDL